jgi:GxxExxY protein
MVGFGVSSGSGFAGTGRVHLARLFILSSFLITEAAGGPLRATERRRATPSGIDRTYHWIGDRGASAYRSGSPGLLEFFYAATLCRELERAGVRVRREVGIPAIYKDEPLPLGFRADIVADETVIPKIKAVSAQLPAHDMQLQTYLRMKQSSGRPAVQRPRAPSERWLAALPRITQHSSPWPIVALVLPPC